MKSFTDISQSKTLAKILPFKSADMAYMAIIEDYMYPQKVKEYRLTIKDECFNSKYDIPAWSLAALLENIPVSCDDGQHCFALINCNPKDDTEWLSCYEDCKGNLLNECYSDNPIDACYEMIVKLKEKGLL